MITETLKTYRPLLLAFAIAFAIATALSERGMLFGEALMGAFLCLLALLQLLDLDGFAAAFARYDLIAARSQNYARVYPFIEILLGCLYLAGILPLLTNIAMLAVMIVGTTGVVKAMSKGLDIQCACAGTAFSLPVGKVTIFENLVMAIMAAANIARLL